MSQPATFITRSALETERFGQRLGQLAPPNTCLALLGNLGAGKTHLTRGIAKGAGVDDPSLVSSPTYVLLNIYQGPKPVFHLDAYRITSEADFETVGLDELLQSSGITVIEWPEKIPHLLPPDRLQIQIDLGDTPDERTLHLLPTGPNAQKLLSILQSHHPNV
jgi:tRNA threonylcarbamoyladenosine biosynthesis protein TsaE